ncbi:conserved hypothetical protein [Histoplasma capsulatum var. duboisii H88]|uniref:Uncharacterized protein n=2 Tax=Ajellomyces capsulatus TaxID=5037 RepID=F0UIR9_AJEC8|nr:conserved hypothetical protein [Histoplasma capsulatum H143]EGC45622.1 conserved hypothetical protein [Histoplasma capsulatum var. duboisii H88]
MAFQSAPQPLPPTTIHYSSSKTHRISPSVAHDFLSAYFDRAATDPSLQPDSTLSTHGPVSANAGSAPNLVIHNLKRVQAGLAGEVLGRDLTLARLDGEGGGPVFALKSREVGGDGEDWGGDGRRDWKEAVDNGWQDLEIYERAQEVMDVGEGEEGDQAQMSMQMQMDTDQGFEAGVGQETGVIDKEERKRKKKERRKEEKRAKSKTTTTG